MLLMSASCVPVNAAPAPVRERIVSENFLPGGDPAAAAVAVPGAAAAPLGMELTEVAPGDAAALNAAIPLASGPNPRAASVVFRAATALDQQRSLQCLAEAVYFEARSESEDGQRAVAQVVLNRVRHPSYPGSVCGVVYQGPMRAGGGCQFTFTCDGSLARAPAGPGWQRALRIAAQALAGAVYAPVGHATHYHTHQVLPTWAYRLAKVGVIGSHNFYRMHDAMGAPAAFRQAYAAREPSPATVMAARLPVFVPGLPSLPTTLTATAEHFSLPAAPAYVEALPQDHLPQAKLIEDKLPDSTVKEEFRNSGRWLDTPKPAAP
jgi:spore germination cell wall hydrolase CwlJ-like protein